DVDAQATHQGRAHTLVLDADRQAVLLDRDRGLQVRPDLCAHLFALQHGGVARYGQRKQADQRRDDGGDRIPLRRPPRRRRVGTRLAHRGPPMNAGPTAASMHPWALDATTHPSAAETTRSSCPRRGAGDVCPSCGAPSAPLLAVAETIRRLTTSPSRAAD